MKVTTEADLNRWFREFDEKHFDGKLSSWKVVVGFHPDMTTDSRGCTVRKEKTIYIPENTLTISVSTLKAALLHEIAHIHGGDYHGEKFKKELKRLQKEGAPVSRKSKR